MLEDLIIKRTDNSPLISFDYKLGVLYLEGDCRPENVKVFFEPLFKWLKKYGSVLEKSNEGKNLTLNFKLEYFNSSSAKYILELIKFINQIRLNNKNSVTTINWFYSAEDEDMMDAGKELARMTKIKINIIQSK